MEDILDSLPDTAEAASLTISVIQAIIFLVVGYIVAKLLAGFIRRQALKHDRIDDTVGSFLASAVLYLIMIVVFIAILQVFGFQATSLVAVLGAASLAIGLSLQGTLANVASGLMLVIVRPFKLGDYVDTGGASGTVTDMRLFTTRLTTPQNVEVVIPNSSVFNSTITNYSTHETRRLDITYGIDYGDDIDKAVGIILDTVAADGRALDDKEPRVHVVMLNDSSVDLQLRVWCRNEDFFQFKFALLKSVKEAFDRGGITIPYPHQVNVRGPE